MQEQRDSQAAAQPESAHGRAARPSAAPGSPPAPAEAAFRSALRSACLFLDQVVLSTLLPDSVLTGREPVFQGVTHL